VQVPGHCPKGLRDCDIRPCLAACAGRCVGAPGGTAGAETGGRGGGGGWGVGVTQYGWYCWKALLQAVILVVVSACDDG
jgi:hypothetical protein